MKISAKQFGLAVGP